MEKLFDLANSLLPVFMCVTITFGTWMVTEIYAAKYSTLKIEDGRRISAEAADYTDDKYHLLLTEIDRLRSSVDKLTATQAKLLAEYHPHTSE